MGDILAKEFECETMIYLLCILQTYLTDTRQGFNQERPVDLRKDDCVIKQSLHDKWRLSFAGREYMGNIPGSVYSILLENKEMEDPYYRDNERKALSLIDNSFTFSRVFIPDGELLQSKRVLLCFDGIDTLCDVFMNGRKIGHSDNMHRRWEFDVTDVLKDGENTLAAVIYSPISYIRERFSEKYLNGIPEAMDGFPYLRKAHYMFGWDWGPRLPDAGIWRGVTLLDCESGRLTDVNVRQTHKPDAVGLYIDADIEGSGELFIRVLSPSGSLLYEGSDTVLQISKPQLWWPNGLGEQPLYTVEIALLSDGWTVDERKLKIGLREISLRREKDEWGESFSHCVNGVSLFAMGANYIPEDNILSRIHPERTRKLLEDCVLANFNLIRVWGGGYYPEDSFYEVCDELGLLVWQDFMFSCANYDLTPAFEENIRQEVQEAVRRLRHHACLALWCGNNEMEMFQMEKKYNGSEQLNSYYFRMFEEIIPDIVASESPDIEYWPSSPSSGGRFDDPRSENRGDSHNWDVWHENRPFHEYRKCYSRYNSEFGFQSFPEMRTIESFTLPEDRNIFSRVMEQHQRNASANGKILNYLSEVYLYPTSFSSLLFASQLLQADALRCGVEHWRRHRGRCMGAVFWQLNDCWPVASWSSIDYFGRWKALQYFAKRFFAPVMISCEEEGEHTQEECITAEYPPDNFSARLCVTNETKEDITGIVKWALQNHLGEILESYSADFTVPSLSSRWMDKMDLSDKGLDFQRTCLSYSFSLEGKVVSEGCVLFTAPKHFRFADPGLSCRREGDHIIVKAKAFAKSVEIWSPDSDLLLSDNFFDLYEKEKTVKILSGEPKSLSLRSVYDVR